MKLEPKPSGFALAITLVLMALIVIVIVAYLANTQTARSTSSVYANQLKARMVAESGLASATRLLKDNTRYGNYITANPAPSPSPQSRYTEIYRPSDVGDATHAAQANAYLSLSNAAGELLVSLASPTPGAPPIPQVDPRPTPAVVPSPLPTLPTPTPFALPSPNTALSAANSYDFNQVIRLGNSNTGRLVDPDAKPALAQWIRVRNRLGELIGRFAFFIEDESMKVNLNFSGNNVGGINLRTNDLTLPATTPAPVTQIAETDPSAVLAQSPAPTPNRTLATTALADLGAAGNRLPSKPSITLINQWNASPAPTPFANFAHLLTSTSKDDNTTSRGWQRLDLNQLVAEADAAGTMADKVAAASRIADWIRDAWTGPVLLNTLSVDSDGRYYQLFNDSRMRQQIAANIVDYIDADNVPTDMGEVLPEGYADPAFKIPVVGIEKIPYLGEIFVLYEASGRPPGGNTATMRMKVRLTFFNLYEATLNLQTFIKRIEIEGVSPIIKNGGTVFDEYSEVYSVLTSELAPLGPNGFDIPPGIDNAVTVDTGSGARTFETVWLEPGTPVTFSTATGNPIFKAATQIQVRTYGVDPANNEIRLETTSAQTTDTPYTGYMRSGSTSVGDFLLNSDTAPRTVAAIYEQKKKPAVATQDFGDPRFRPNILNDRWRRLGLTDDVALSDRLNKMDGSDTTYPNPRVYAIDWFDYYQNRPLAFLRNGPMLNIGELGNVCFAEYPWRSGYLQYPERLAVSTDAATTTEITNRRSGSLDYVLTDLFRAGGPIVRDGAININSQQSFGAQQTALAPLFLGMRVGAQTLNPTTTFEAVTKIVSNPNSSPTPSPTIPPGTYSLLQRRSLPNAPADDNPMRPFFQIGEMAPVLGRLAVTNDGTTTGSSRSAVSYSVLRNNPTNRSSLIANYQRDMGAEQIFREISNSITTRGNVFRVLYVGQSIKDLPSGTGTLGEVESPSREILGEVLGEAYIERQSSFVPELSNPDAMKVSDSTYKLIGNRYISQ